MDLSIDLNLLNVLNLRKVEHLPPHFEVVAFDRRATEKDISDWIYENLRGRFYQGSRHMLDDSGKISITYIVGFEEHSEATYFSLVLPEVNKKNFP